MIVWGRDRIHFDFGVFVSQLKLADWRKIGIAFGCIYICYVIRAARWAMLIRHIKKVPLLSPEISSTPKVAPTGMAAFDPAEKRRENTCANQKVAPTEIARMRKTNPRSTRKYRALRFSSTG